MLEVQEPIIRVTRKRQVVIVPTPKSSVRKRQKVIPQLPQHESGDEGAVSEAESHVSGVSMVVPSTGRRTRNKAKSQRDSSQESYSETISDAEWSCSGISSLESAPRRTGRNVQKKLEFQDEKKDTEITPGNKKPIVGPSVDSEDSEAKQPSQLSSARLRSQINMPTISDSETYNNDFDDSIHRNSGEKLTTQNQNLHIQEEKQADVVSLTEVIKNCKNLDEEDPKVIEEK